MASKAKVTAGAALVAACCAFLSPFEGVRLTAYPDPARPDLATICYGETQGVRFGQTRTAAECRAMLEKRIPDYLGPVDALMPGLPDHRRIAYTDFAYNAGVATLRKSRIPAFEKVGRVDLACNELTRYVYAGGKQLPGLVKRREQEKKLCLNG